MRLLLDTHVLIWAAAGSPRLPAKAGELIDNMANEVFFSVASLWEVAIKSARGREDFDVDAAELRAALLANAYAELPIRGEHALHVAQLPRLHRDPFDRLLVAQALCEGLTLVSGDALVASYSPTILRV